MFYSPVFPAQNSKVVSPGDNLESLGIKPKAIYVGTAGHLVVRLYGQRENSTFMNAPVGYHPLEVAEIDASTAAGNLLAVW